MKLRKLDLAAAALLLALPALAAKPAPADKETVAPPPEQAAVTRLESPDISVSRTVRPIKVGDIEVRTPVSGISTAQDTYDVFAPFDGRVEEVQVELFNMVTPKSVLARMVPNEMAALLDSTPDSGRKQAERRWQDVYQFSDVKPEFKGIVTNIYVEPRTAVYKGDRLFTIAKKVVVIGKNTKPVYSGIADDMSADIRHFRTGEEFKTKLVNFIKLRDRPYFFRLWLEVLDLKEGIHIGEQFDGELFVGKSSNTRLIPKKNLFETGGRKYMMMEVESGLITEDEVEILRPAGTYLELLPAATAQAPVKAAVKGPAEEEAAAAAPPVKKTVVKKTAAKKPALKEPVNGKTREAR